MTGNWKTLAKQPTFGVGTMLLLTDGTVMCQNSGKPDWWKLTPDSSGDYIHGTWSKLASMTNAPLYFASAVLKDGRVFVAGGEYNNGKQVDLLAAEIYDPLANTWTSLPTPPGWKNIGDAPCCVLPDGKLLLGSISDTRTAIYDPVTNTWTPGGSKDDSSSEETWTLLPDETVLSVECSHHPQAEKYVIATNQWVSAGSTPTDLVEAGSIEIGPAILLSDGRVFAIGATGNTALYTRPPIANQLGSWAAGPNFPSQKPGETLGAKDAPACLLPNGRVLCVAGPVDGKGGDYLAPTYFFEFDPASSKLTAIANPPNSGKQPFTGRMLLLPTGQVLFANGSQDVEVYTPDGIPEPAWQPQITSCPSSLFVNGTYTLQGRQLNGLSQAVSYGDDASMATNYPLVRISHKVCNKIVYCRTFNHSTMSVATGSVIHSTQFIVPLGIQLGASVLSVIANGIASQTISVTLFESIGKLVLIGPFGGSGGSSFQDGTLPNGAKICKVRIRHGFWLDAIGLSYKVNGQVTDLPMHGGDGGTYDEFIIDDDEYITSLGGRYAQFVNSVIIHTNKRTSSQYGGDGGSADYNNIDIQYPNQEFVGFLGRSGKFLDAIGIVLAIRES